MSDGHRASPETGRVYLVGAGPGAPGLLTLRGRDLLARADTVVHDYLVSPVHLRHVREDCEIISVGDRGQRLDQRSINDLLVLRGLQGEMVVRLKGGDPFVFGRGGEEASALAAAGVPFEVVPGVTAAVASAAYAGIPMTHRGYGPSMALVTAHRADAPNDVPVPAGTPDPDDETDLDAPGAAGGGAIRWSALAGIDTLAFYMGAGRAAAIAARLVEAGRSGETPVAFVRNATRPDQSVFESTLAGVAAGAAAHVRPPAVIIVGEVVRLRARLAWAEHRPLHGLRVGVTRAASQGDDLIEALEAQGADTLAMPTLDFAPPLDAGPLQVALATLAEWHWLVFTSTNGVDFFMRALHGRGLDARALAGLKLACVGPATVKALRAWGLRADRIPDRFVAEGLIAAFEADLTGQRVLVARAAEAREVLPEALRARGAEVQVVPVYRSVTPPLAPGVVGAIAAGHLDLITFTSASTVTRLMSQLDPVGQATLRARVGALCIGPVTAEAARAAGLRVDVCAPSHTAEGLVDALVAWRSAAETPSN